MIDLTIAVVPFLAVAVANFVVSWIYYSPMVPWFKTWQIGVGQDPNKKEMTAEEKKAMPRLMGGAVVASLLISFVMQVMVSNLGASTFMEGAVIGFLLWAGFAVTHSLNTQFEGRKVVVLVINNGLYLLTYIVFAGLLAIL